MQGIGIGDVIFILLVLGLIHGIMFWVARGKRADKKPSTKPAGPES